MAATDQPITDEGRKLLLLLQGIVEFHSPGLKTLDDDGQRALSPAPQIVVEASPGGGVVGDGGSGRPTRHRRQTSGSLQAGSWDVNVEASADDEEDEVRAPIAVAGAGDFQAVQDNAAAYKHFVKGHVKRAEVKIYAPEIFNWLHGYFGLSTDSYLRDWQQTLDGLRSGAVRAKKAATGRSGALFLRSASQRLIIKTIPQIECLALRKFLRDYVGHFIRQPRSLLMKFFGLYRLLPGGVGSSPVYVVAVNNFLWYPHPAATSLTVYDLKARVHGDRVVDPRLASLDVPPGAVRRDDQLDRPFPVDDANTAFLVQQLLADVDWLRAHDCMDYSLLVGVRKHADDDAEPPPLTDLHAEPPRPSLVFVLPSRASAAETFSFGVIDILTEWGPKKIVAHNLKKQLHSVRALSTVEPNYYAQRWQPFLSHILPLDFVLLASPDRPSN